MLVRHSSGLCRQSSCFCPATPLRPLPVPRHSPQQFASAAPRSAIPSHAMDLPRRTVCEQQSAPNPHSRTFLHLRSWLQTFSMTAPLLATSGTGRIPALAPGISPVRPSALGSLRNSMAASHSLPTPADGPALPAPGPHWQPWPFAPAVRKIPTRIAPTTQPHPQRDHVESAP